MRKNKKNNSSTSVDSKMDKTKNVIRKTGEIAGETAKTLVAIATLIAAYKGLKGNNKQ